MQITSQLKFYNNVYFFKRVFQQEHSTYCLIKIRVQSISMRIFSDIFKSHTEEKHSSIIVMLVRYKYKQL